jgi:RNA polymerase subunit RPABC4/transcription elongation factor Spt4
MEKRVLGGTNRPANEAGACEHCGGLVYGDSLKCPQCGKFPVKIHQCKHCGCISASTADRCWKCGRMFAPESDYL